jgi:FkbM family methyltransferase
MRKYVLAVYKCTVQKLLKTGLLPRLYWLRAINHFVISRFTPTFAIIQGKKLFLDSVDSLGLARRGEYEPFTTEVAQSIIKKGDLILDIGANIGYYTVIFSEATGENGKVIAFEPDPTNYSLLIKNLKVNGCTNVMPEQEAVAGKTERLQLFLSLRSKGHHRIFAPHDAGRAVGIGVVSLDDYFRETDGKIDFIKMDIEGAEPYALNGMREVLMRSTSLTMITEFNPTALRILGYAPSDYLYSLIKLGFELYDINEKSKRLEQASASGLVSTYDVASGGYTNLLCTRRGIRGIVSCKKVSQTKSLACRDAVRKGVITS